MRIPNTTQVVSKRMRVRPGPTPLGRARARTVSSPLSIPTAGSLTGVHEPHGGATNGAPLRPAAMDWPFPSPSSRNHRTPGASRALGQSAVQSPVLCLFGQTVSVPGSWMMSVTSPSPFVLRRRWLLRRKEINGGWGHLMGFGRSRGGLKDRAGYGRHGDFPSHVNDMWGGRRIHSGTSLPFDSAA